MSDDKSALTAWYREGAAMTINGETTWPDATGNGRTLFGVDLAQGSDQQAFAAIESTFATPPKFAPILIPASAPTIGERTEIDPRAVYEPQQYPSVVGRWTVTREQATPAPWCLTFQRAVSEDEMRRHVADYDRTRITPGADPRDGWTSSVDECEAAESPLPIFEIRNGLRPLVALQGRNARSFEEWGYEPGQVRYVPEDVRRWRNPSHRRSLHRRAREYAECAQTLVDR